MQKTFRQGPSGDDPTSRLVRLETLVEQLLEADRDRSTQVDKLVAVVAKLTVISEDNKARQDRMGRLLWSVAGVVIMVCLTIIGALGGSLVLP